MAWDAVRVVGILLLFAGALSAQGTGSAPPVSAPPTEPAWLQPAILLVGAIVTALGSWIAALVVKILGKVAERAGHRLSAEQEETLHRWAEIAVRAAEETAAARGLKQAGERKFAEVLGAAQKRFPSITDDTLKIAINGAIHRVPGLGKTGNP